MTRREAQGLLSLFKEREAQSKAFFKHLAAYLAFNTFFFAMNITEGPDGPLFLVPLLLWGTVLAFHYHKTFGLRGQRTKGWEEQMIQELMYGDADLDPLSDQEALLLQLQALRAKTQKAQAKVKPKAMPKALPEPEPAEQILRRLQNLEAIVTSKDWDLAQEAEAAGLTTAEQTKVIAERVR